jgi:hypothetical protein
MELKIKQKHGTSLDKLVLSRRVTNRASVRPSDIFAISNSVHPDLAYCFKA